MLSTKPKIAVYAIALNEIKFVDTFMQHCQGADVILVADTGSTDGTAERLRELGATVYNISIKPWRFDHARNAALSLVPADVDICLTVDLDECLTPGWTDALTKLWQEHDGKINRISYDYIWNWKEDGSPDVRFYGDRWHSRQGYQWRHPCHETVYWVGAGEEKRARVEGLQLHHHADLTKSRGQYLPLLKLAVEEDPNNDRMRHYYARELMFVGDYTGAIKEFEHHLAMPSATWKEERCASLRYISRCYRKLNDLKQSQSYALLSVAEWDQTREPWMEVCRAAYASLDWPTVYWAATKCLSITTQSQSYMSNSENWGAAPYDFAAMAAYYLGLKQQAVDYGAEAVRLSPDDKRLYSNLAYYQAV